MNVDSYKMYLQSLGNVDKFINAEIAALNSVEHNLGVDLDDYMPFGGEYSNISRLEEQIMDKMRMTEDLQAALNRYISFRLDNIQ